MHALRLGKQLPQPFQTPAGRAAQLTEGKVGGSALVADDARCGNHTHDPAQSADDRSVPCSIGQNAGGIDTILQRQQCRIGTDHGPDGNGGLRHLPGLDPDYHEIDDPHVCGITRGLRRLDGKITLKTFDLQSFGPNGRQVLAPGNESDVDAGLGQTPAEISAHSPRTVDGHAHGSLHVSCPFLLRCPCRPSRRPPDRLQWGKRA